MTNKEQKKLEKLLFYVLGRRPDEFGLVLDKDGYVRLKDLHKALIEEEGTKGLRLKQLRDFLLIFKPDLFEYRDNEGLIRVKPEFIDPAVLEYALAEEIPTQMYTPVRPRAWIRVSSEGLVAETIVLSPDKELIQRIARRRGALVITVNSRKAQEQGAIFQRYLEKIYLASWLPAISLHGPVVDEEFKKRYQRPKKEKKENEPSEPEIIVSPVEIPYRKLTKGRKKELSWKKIRKERRRGR